MFGVAGLRNAKVKVGSGNGVAKLKKNLLRPKIASLVTVGVGDQRQLTARFFGVRAVSTKFGEYPGISDAHRSPNHRRCSGCPAHNERRANCCRAG